MVINVPVYIVSTKSVEGVHVREVHWNARTTIEPNQVTCPHDRGNGDDAGDAVSVVELWFDQPHPCHWIWFITIKFKPINECTLIAGGIVDEGKESANTCDHHAEHPNGVFIDIDQDGVVARSQLVPGGCAPDVLLVHPTGSCSLAWRVENRASRVVYRDAGARGERRAGVEGHIDAELEFRVEFIIQEAAEMFREPGLTKSIF